MCNQLVMFFEQGAEVEDCGVLAVQINPDDPLTAWSIGRDKRLICTDLANNQILASTNISPKTSGIFDSF